MRLVGCLSFCRWKLICFESIFCALGSIICLVFNLSDIFIAISLLSNLFNHFLYSCSVDLLACLFINNRL